MPPVNFNARHHVRNGCDVKSLTGILANENDSELSVSDQENGVLIWGEGIVKTAFSGTMSQLHFLRASMAVSISCHGISTNRYREVSQAGFNTASATKNTF